MVDRISPDIVEQVTDELLAHGEFSSGANNRSNAREAARVVVDMVSAALQPSSAASGEPVAWWAYCEKTGGQMVKPSGLKYMLIEQANGIYGKGKYELQPLYTAPVEMRGVREALLELSQCDGSFENVANADILARRVRQIAANALGTAGLHITAPAQPSSEPTAAQVDAALNAWFKSPPSETDQGLERSMKAALISASMAPSPRQGNRFCSRDDCPWPDCVVGSTCSISSTPRVCAKCGCETKSEEVLVNGDIWCHPCADTVAMPSPQSESGK